AVGRDFDREGLDAALAFLVALAGLAVVAVGMQRADDLVADDHAVGQRAAAVGALVGHGEYLAGAAAEDGHALAAELESAAQALRDLVDTADGRQRDRGGGHGSPPPYSLSLSPGFAGERGRGEGDSIQSMAR